MKLAFALFRYFPYGGLERDLLALAQLMHARGHDVTIYTRSWEGPRPDLPVVLLPVRALTNHGSNAAFARRLQSELPADVDAVVGFNKMPGLDFYYAADVCFARKAYAERSWIYRLTSRARSSLVMEEHVFGRGAHTQILMISQPQVGIYQRYYGTDAARFHMLPPGIRRDRIMPDDYTQRRAQLRADYGLSDADRLLMMVGSDFRRKGLDRAIRALAAMPAAERAQYHLWVAGQDKAQPFEQLARELGVSEQVRILGGRDDVSELLWAADMLLHPAYSENTGTALLEGMVAGLPVIATATCGYAHYIDDYRMGEILADEAGADVFAAAIRRQLQTDRDEWVARARHMIDHADIFSMTERAAELIERGASRTKAG